MARHYRQSPDYPWTAYVWPVLLGLLIGGVLLWRLWPPSVASLYDPAVQPQPVAPRGDLTELEKTNIKLFREVSPSVVHITTLRTARSGPFNLNAEQIPEGTGSGFLWNEEGHVVTNYHVIQNADAAQVMLADRSVWDAKVVGGYPDRDLAVLWVGAPRKKLRHILVGSSHDLQVGQMVYAIGNPFGLDQTLTTGIISALDREIRSTNGRTIPGVIQTDASINPGNSGGPLLDSAGRLIGVNTAILSPSGTSAGIGFAIPVDEVNRVVTELIRHGTLKRPALGVEVASDSLAREVGIQGALVLNVQPRSPAEKSGLRPTRRDRSGQILLGDIIVALGEREIKSVNDLFNALETHRAGDSVTLTVVREGERRQVEATLEPGSAAQ